MFHIKNVFVTNNGGPILKNITFEVVPGSIHAIMGPNGSGKSSLAHALIGYPGYEITEGSVMLAGNEIAHLSIEKRAQAGLFLAFQYPCALPGVSVLQFLSESYRSLGNISRYAKLLIIDEKLLHRDLNDGFSGGEKKKFELLQLLVLQPKIAILDEIDSGLDVDALKIVAHALHVAKQENPDMAILIITHYQRILQYIAPDCVHVISGGKIIQSGGAALAYEIDQKGYDEYQRDI